MSETFRYKAFISYCHDDETWAKWLHKSLESYRPPKSLNVSEKLKPIFRDRDELAASRDLSASILAALTESENLIVICSRAAARSHWVSEEVTEFARLGRGDRTYCLIVDGTPNDLNDECLPEALRREDGKEPLGVDVRSDADGKNGAKLKIAAALLGVRFDQLRQRENQARFRRLVFISGSSLIGMILAVTLAVFALISREQAIDSRNEANEQRAVAIRESEVANQTTEFLIDLFNVSDPSEARGNSITAREVLDHGAEKINAALNTEPVIKARLLRTIGRVYQELGLYGAASRALTLSLEIQRELGESDPQKLATVLDDIGDLKHEVGDFDAARSYYREALELRQSQFDQPHVDIVRSLRNVAISYWRQDQLHSAMELTQQARTMLLEVPGKNEQLQDSLTNNLANIYSYMDRNAEAEHLQRELLEARYARYGENHLSTGFAHDNLAITLDALEKWEEAEQHYRKALQILLLVYGDDHPEVAQTMANVGSFLVDRGAFNEAEDLLLKAIEIHRSTIGNDYFMVADSLSTLSKLRLEQGKKDSALDLMNQALAIYGETLPVEHSKTRDGQAQLAEILIALNRFEEAERLLLELFGSVDREGQAPTYELVTGHLVSLYTAWGKPELAARYDPLSTDRR